MELFKSIRIQSDQEKEQDEKINFPIFRTVEYTIQDIVNKICNIDNLSDDEIRNIIVRQHSMILNYDLFLKSDESRKYAQMLFTNKRFLFNMISIINLIQLTREEIICMNKLAYDYYITENKDREISDMLCQISYQINNALVIKLSGKLGINGARILSMIANSSFQVEKNVHRVNTFLVKCEIDLSIQDLVDMYCILFDRFTNTFTYTMLEEKLPGMTNEQCRRFDNISIAILTILNSLTTNDMKKVLYNYGYILKLSNNKNKVRFGLKSALSYYRILNAINEIECSDIEGIIIP